MKFLRNPRAYLFIISFFLFIIPFFWLKPGQMDLGGDASRLYFYDSLNYLRTTVLYAINPIGMNGEDPYYFLLPFTIILAGLRKLLSPYLIITLYNSLHLVVAFLSMYAISKKLLRASEKKEHRWFLELSSMFVGLFYIFHPFMQYSAWDKALTTHAQVFLNPVIFYLLLRFFLTRKTYFLLLTLFVTVIFSTNFSWSAAPVFLAFYPLAFLYLVLYAAFIRKKGIPIKAIFFSCIVFLMLHAFHLLPLITSFIGKTGHAYEKAVENAGTFNAGLAYFLEVARQTSVVQNLLGFPLKLQNFSPFEFLFFVFPAMLFVALIRNRSLNFLLLFVFFLATVFLTTAKVSQASFEFYKYFFNFPVFAMFRNFNGQFFFVYFFFLSVLIGQSFFYISIFLKTKKQKIGLYAYITILVLLSAIPFIRGDMINLIWNKGEKVEFKVPIKMDPEYENFLQYIRENAIDGKYLTLPLTESFNQVLRGTQGGMYIGPSMIAHLTGKSDFNGYQVLFPFSQTLLELVKAKEYRAIETLLSVLNIKYIFYNADDSYKYFPHFPYEHVRKYLLDHDSYNEFLGNLAITKKQSFGNLYNLYKVNDDIYLPRIYIAKKTAFFDRKKYIVNVNNVDYTTDAFWRGVEKEERRFVYLEDKKVSDITIKQVPKISVQRINPTRYIIQIKKAKEPYMLVLSNAFHPKWQLFVSDVEQTEDLPITTEYFDGDIKEAKAQDIWVNRDMLATWIKKPIADSRHFKANVYANSWYILPSDVDGQENYTLILEMTSQRVFYVGLLISIIGFGVCIIWVVVLISRVNKRKIAHDKTYISTK